MEIQGIAQAVGIVQSGKSKSEVSNNSENNFLNSLVNLSITNQGKSDVPMVYAGAGKGFEFWAKDEKVSGKADKMFSLDEELEDALEKIGIILNKLKEEKEK
ncbi:MAG: hypothetical protein WCV91_00890 [Candidatus Margulisiibacteriota bacterium]